MTYFPNRAGDHAHTDDALRAELKAAGIPTLQEEAGREPDYLADTLRRTSGEVKTSVSGVLHGWSFERAWYYWVARGPGIAVEDAMALHKAHGQAVRVGGHCGCPSPAEYYHGLACGLYHVDDAAGLRALADCIRGIAERSKAKPTPIAYDGSWDAVADFTGMRKLHGNEGPAPTIPEMVGALKNELRSKLLVTPHADLADVGIESLVASLLLRVETGEAKAPHFAKAEKA